MWYSSKGLLGGRTLISQPGMKIARPGKWASAISLNSKAYSLLWWSVIPIPSIPMASIWEMTCSTISTLGGTQPVASQMWVCRSIFTFKNKLLGTLIGPA